MGIIEKISGLVSRSTGLTLFLVAVLAALSISAIIDLSTLELRLVIDPSANRLLSENQSAKQFYDKTRRIFGSDETLVITLSSDNIFKRDTLERINRMTEQIGELEAVHHVVSLANALDIRSVDGGLDIAPFISNIEEQAGDIGEIRERVLNHPIYAGGLVSTTGDATALVVYFHDISDREFISSGIHDQIVSIVDAEKGGNDIWLTGSPHFKVSMIRLLIRDLIWTPPIITVILVVVLAFSFRTLQGVVVPILTVGTGVILTLGTIAGLGYSLSMISVLVPPLLMILGLSYSVHVVSEYQQLQSEPGIQHSIIYETLNRIMLPVVLTGLTTIAGFVALMVNPIEAIREFGFFSVIGVIYITILSLTLTPALLKIMDRKPGRIQSRKKTENSPMFDRFVDAVTSFDLKHRYKIFTGAALIFLLSIAGMSQIRVNTDSITNFSPDSDLRKGYEFVNEKLGGANPFYIVFEGNRRDTFKEPGNLELVKELQTWLERQPEIGGSSSIADYIMLVNQAFHDNDPAFFSIPENKQLITQLLFLSSSEELDRVVDKGFTTTNLVVRSKVVDSEEMARLIDRINKQLTGLPEHLTATITGNPILINETLTDVITGQARSVGLALIIVYGILSIMFMSQRIGFIALIPNVLPVAVYFGSLGIFGISLNPSTSLIAPMVLGIAIDDTIHYFARFNMEVKRVANDRIATLVALKSVGRPVTYTSIGLCLGFLALMTSELRMQVNVGIMASYALAVAWLCDFLVTPALCASVRITTLWDALTLDLGTNPQESIPLLNGLRTSQARIVALMAKVVEVPAGKRIITEGEIGSEMFVVIDGKLGTTIDGEHGTVEVATHTRGDVVGEAGLFHEKRAANVDTIEDSRLLSLSQSSLDRLSKRYPYIATKVFRNLNRILAARLSTTTHRLT